MLLIPDIDIYDYIQIEKLEREQQQQQQQQKTNEKNNRKDFMKVTEKEFLQVNPMDKKATRKRSIIFMHCLPSDSVRYRKRKVSIPRILDESLWRDYLYSDKNGLISRHTSRIS